MNEFNPIYKITPSVLATDLDGTLIPLPDNNENKSDLRRIAALLAAGPHKLIFATGRHFESVLEAIEHYHLPEPEWIISDVGSAIYQRREGAFHLYERYETHLRQLTEGTNRNAVEVLLSPIEAITPQDAVHQQRFKISYECTPEQVDPTVAEINKIISSARQPYAAMGSVDPLLGIGLIDVLPLSVNKAYALLWLSTHADFSPNEVIYSGDSGNDLAALTSGFRAIIVANASPGLALQVAEAHRRKSIVDRFIHTQGKASSGVLEGCRHFGLFQ
jgi:HAD superfamily hydrolase (TIGR01484 family)